MKTLWYVIFLSYLSLFALGFLDNHRGPFYETIMRELNLTDVQISYFFSLTSLTAFVFSYAMPQLLKRVSLVTPFRISLTIFALGFLGFSLSYNLAHLLVSSFVFGLGFGALAVVQNLMVHQGSEPLQRRSLFSGLHSVYALASLLAPLSISVFSQMGWGWRSVFQWASLVPLSVVILSFINRSSFVLLAKQERFSLGESPLETKREISLDTKKWAHFYAVVFSLCVAGEITISSRLVPFSQRALSMSFLESNERLIVFFVCLFLGRFLFSLIPYRGKIDTWILSALLLSSLSSYLGFSVNLWFLSLSGLFLSICFPAFLEYLSLEFKENATYAISILMAFGSLAVVIVHMLLGYFTEIYGMKVALYISPILLLMTFVLFLIRRGYFYFLDSE